MNICGKYCWPYTENNQCVLKPGHKGDHMDRKGREFGISYRKKGIRHDKVGKPDASA